MVKRIINLMRQDWTNASRDNILLYMMFGPIILALGARLFLPSLDQAQYTFAVQKGTDSILIQRLEQIGKVELYEDEAAVRARVLRSDDVPGLLLHPDGMPALIFEGNEGGEADVLRSVIEQALSGEVVSSYTRTQTGETRVLLTEYAAIIFIMIGMLLGALVMAFNIIEDKESGAVRALGVSPLSMLELTLSRGLFTLVLSLGVISVTTFILLGTGVNNFYLMTGYMFSLGLPILSGYIIGGLSDSQLKAIAIIKFYMMIYLTLPIVTIFLSRSWHPFFYVLPNYWMWRTFEKALIGTLDGPGFWLSGCITLLFSLLLVAALLPLLRRQLKLR